MVQHDHLGFRARFVRAAEDWKGSFSDAGANAQHAIGGAVVVFVASLVVGGLSWDQALEGLIWAAVGGVGGFLLVPLLQFIHHMQHAEKRIRDDWIWRLEQRIEVLEIRPEGAGASDPIDEFQYWKVPILYAGIPWFSSRFHKPEAHCPNDDSELLFVQNSGPKAPREIQNWNTISKSGSDNGVLFCVACDQSWTLPQPMTYGNAQSIAEALSGPIIANAREAHNATLAAKKSTLNTATSQQKPTP